jgi:membrane-bound metal-dependent hydrolase YbcI (DUF457 family)
MRGESHMAISMFVYLPTFFFLLKLYPSRAVLNNLSALAAGIMLGSLLPDLDAPDSKIMHGWWRPFGLFYKYAFFKPLARLFGQEHRGIMHSVLGCLFTTLFIALISLVLYPVIFFIWYIWIGIPIGFLLHLAEDSFTVSGVRWFFSRGEPIRSTTITNSGGEYLLVGFAFIVFGSLTLLGYLLLPASTIAVFLISGVSIGSLVILHRINPRISEIAARRYSLERLVEIYVENQGGKRIKPTAPSGNSLQIEIDENQPKKPYIVKILDVGGRFGLDRDWQNAYSRVEASSLDEGDIVEMRTYEGKKENRIYYIVQNGVFRAFLKRVI